MADRQADRRVGWLADWGKLGCDQTGARAAFITRARWEGGRGAGSGEAREWRWRLPRSQGGGAAVK
jgi:hypothetical protein